MTTSPRPGPGSRPGASTLWILLLTGASTATTFLLGCATPFAALAALAATHMNRRDGLMLMGLTWLTSQIVGFACLGYPHSAKTFGWAVALAMGALAAGAASGTLLDRSRATGMLARLALAYGSAFIAFKLPVVLWSFVLGGHETLLDPGLLARQFTRDGAFLLGLLALYHALVALGLPGARPQRLAAA